MHNPPINQCIYCLKKPGDITWVDKQRVERQLTLADFGREHVIPAGLGGTVVLGAASCPNCEGITGNYERIVARDMLWALRSLSGHRSGLRIPDGPVVAVIPKLLPPSILLGSIDQPLTLKFVRITVDTDDLQALRLRSHQELPTKFIVDHIVLSRVVAKIAHGSCIQRWGLGGFIPFLPKVILGQREDYWRFIGGREKGAQTSDLHRIDTEGVHLTAFDQIAFHGAEFLRVTVNLFHSIEPFPSFQAIAGVLPGCNKAILRELQFRGFLDSN